MSAPVDLIAAKECGACSACHTPAKIARPATRTGSCDYVVALAGNPNTGKSTIFNALTGLRQHVGNWPGKTVRSAEGTFRYNAKTFRLVDLPGTYSLLSASADEEVARDFVLFGRPDVTVVVTDANRLERNLCLAMQILEITDHAVIALNLLDEARRNNVTVDTRALARDLGVPVVPMSARRGEGVPDLLRAVEMVAEGTLPTRPRRIEHRDEVLDRSLGVLEAQIRAAFPELPNARWVALRLLEGDESVVRAVREGTLGHTDRAPDFARRVRAAEAS